ncbi:pyruvate formate-lyase [Sporolactobacillus inulinus]|uniref:Pyruvate formate-lyase n=1 Tax=Sporolactobacillus inulinus TaxID=2078 RepID=A0A4Y1Z8L2_9BACL|nr:pyruvate formate-lyase [Sporolactobacillus inulinus]
MEAVVKENKYDSSWDGFADGIWKHEIDVRDFIIRNIHTYTGDESFLSGPTKNTTLLWKQVMQLSEQERKNGGVLDMDTEIVSTITSHKPGYLNKNMEKIVGFQTDKPFKRALMPFGGIRMADQAAASYGFKIDKEVDHIFTEYRKTHNQGVFDAYTDEMRLARHVGIITGLPDAYGRGRIIGDYRRVALYGIDFLIEQKQIDKKNTGSKMSEDVIRLREELTEQIRALQDIKKMAASYGFDISKPASNAQEAFQWLYFGYLAAVKEQNGAAMSLGRTSSFLDIFIERDLKTTY